MSIFTLNEIPRSQWAPGTNHPSEAKRFKVWLSEQFLVQAFNEPGGIVRLSINRPYRDKAQGGRWKDGITWDELQAIKDACGYADRDAVEVYPAQEDLVNVANMRHIWVLPERVPFAWRQNGGAA